MTNSRSVDEGCTLGDVQSALQFLAYDVRDDWVMAGMAIKAEFGEGGFPVWDDWSAQYDKYKPGEVRSVWRSFKGGQVGIGSLFHLAISNGYKWAERSDGEKARFVEEQKKRRAHREIEIAAEEKQAAAMQDVVAHKAFEMWNELSLTGRSKYLDEKQVKAYGVRFVSRGMVIIFNFDSLLIETISGSENIKHFFSDLKDDETSFLYVKAGYIATPLIDENNVLRNLQFTLPNGTKLFLKHAQKQGCFHLIGKHSPGSPVCVVEGYATGATVYEAAGWLVGVSFDAGNLSPVAKILRSRFPDEKIILCGDDDTTTKSNPGRRAASQAAAQISGLAVFPSFEETVSV